jgi:hypothetical protein
MLVLLLFINELWLTLQHANVWLNVWVQRLDRDYGIHLIQRGEHMVIAAVLGMYWSREIVSMGLSACFINDPYALLVAIVSAAYHTVKVFGITRDCIYHESDPGILLTVIDNFRCSTVTEVLKSVLRFSLQGLDTAVHAYLVVRLYIEADLEPMVFITVVVVWMIHQLVVFTTQRSTATRPVEFFRHLIPARLTRAVTQEPRQLLSRERGPVDTVLLVHIPRDVFSGILPEWALYLLTPLAWVWSLVVLLTFQAPIVMDRFTLPNKRVVETWLVPAFGYQYVLWPAWCRHKVIYALEVASARGATRVALGALNKAQWIWDPATAQSAGARWPDLDIMHGNTLTASILLQHIVTHPGSRETVVLIGPTSKIGRAIVQHLILDPKVHRVFCVTRDAVRFQTLLVGDGASTKLTRLESPPERADLWVLCRPTSGLESVRSSRSTHERHGPVGRRADSDVQRPNNRRR